MARHRRNLLIIVLVCCGAGSVCAETANRIVAVVNDEVITEADVNTHVAQLLEEHKEQTPMDAPSAEMREVVLQRLIEQRLMLQEAKRLKIVLGEGQVAQRLEELRGRFDSEEEFRKSLVESNLTEGQLKEKIRDQLLVQAAIDAKVRSTINVSPQEVSRAVAGHQELVKPGERVRALHILVRVTDERPEPKARQRIEEIRRQLRDGADFAALAKRYSEDGYGGVIDWAARGELLPELDAALFSLAPGVMSDPIQTKLGFHLLNVEERKIADSLSVMEANRAVYQQLYQQKFLDSVRRWLDGLKAHAYIQVLSSP